ncbi:hypothetical protein TNCV_4878361 [Trichonephila clavipes]|nr:hypothetical protein TNCV_4878361 [Trichonephila clavipes]
MHYNGGCCALILTGSESQKVVKAARDIYHVYGVGVVDESTAWKWFAELENGDFDIYDTPRLGRPSKFDEELSKALLMENGHQINSELAPKKRNCDHKTILNHLN